MTDTIVTHVWSSFGHRFMSEDGSESCMTCGARYHLVPREDDPTGGDYATWNGDDPVQCPGEDRLHGEQPCMRDECDHTSPCEHESPHDCNCLLCTG